MQGKKEILVEDEDLASFLGNIDAEVLATPRLISLLEEAARTATEEGLPEGSMTVGTLVKVRHLAATPPGLRVRAEASLKKIDGRRLVFDVIAYDDFEKIAEGEHERFIVSTEQFLKRVQKKITTMTIHRTKGSRNRGPH
jgi:predicted thioesterase